MLKNGKASFAVLVDVKSGPLERAMANAVKFDVDKSCDFRLGNGLEPLAVAEADVISVCGMGGDTIMTMINASLDVAKKSLLVLQPQTHAGLVMKRLGESGFDVYSHAFALERGMAYRIMGARFTGVTGEYTDEECAYPLAPANARDAGYMKYLVRRREIMLEARRGAAMSSRTNMDSTDPGAFNDISMELDIIEDRLKLCGCAYRSVPGVRTLDAEE
jgi:tRNA A22 N-methylase